MSFPITNPFQNIKRPNIRPALVFGLIIISALFFFEMFNYSTTEFALKDLLGDLRFMGIQWATLLSVAFCGIDFAGIARLFTPEQGDEEHKEVWYLFGAWLLAATMNATLTWWGVSMAISNHSIQSAAVVAPKTIQTVIPIFVAIMVWVIRILIIGTIANAGDRLLWGKARRTVRTSPVVRSNTSPAAVNNSTSAVHSTRPVATASYSRPASTLYTSPRETAPVQRAEASRAEPTYHSLSKGESADGGKNANGPRRF